MTYRRLPANTPAILKAAGLKVEEIDGWQTRGRPASTGGFNPKGVLCHHTATGPKTSNAAVARLLVNGRSDLPGPLCQFGLRRDGTVVIIASGRANHAGRAKASGNMPSGDGNELYIGIEAYNDGVGEPWGKAQMEAYSLLCAVLSVKFTKNTSASVRGHKETSVTGKIDPKFDMVAFRRVVAAKIKALQAPKPPAKPEKRRTIAHISMQFSDSSAQHTADIEKVFKAGLNIITGTEAGPGSGNMNAELIRIAAKYGYVLSITNRYDTWVAVKKTLVKTGTTPVTSSVFAIWRYSRYTPTPPGKWSDKGIVFVTYHDKELGLITVGSVHYVTVGGAGKALKRTLDAEYAKKIGAFAKSKGAGYQLVFIGGDFNLSDRLGDVFKGQPLTTCWDELKKWPDTGHGNIDAIASYDGDGRVRCLDAQVLKDGAFFLNTDHFLVRTTYGIRVP